MDDDRLKAMKRIFAFAMAAQAAPKKGKPINPELKEKMDKL